MLDARRRPTDARELIAARGPPIIGGMQHSVGPYRVLRTIALGGMGEVFLAALEREGGFQKLVALKRALPRLMDDPTFADMFVREARLAAALSHRNIVQIFDFGREGESAWLAMEYVHGVDLKAVQDHLRGQPLPLGIAVEIGLSCARALAYAHRARDPEGRALGLIHRDVSPQNVLLSFEGDVKLADFGLARAAGEGEVAALRGKFAYMSPEQVASAPLDARCDLFSLGIVLYEMFSGARAFFDTAGAKAILERVARGEPIEPLKDVAPDLHPALRHVVLRAMAPDPEARYPSADALARDLVEAAAAAGVHVGHPPLGPWLAGLFPERAVAVPRLGTAAPDPLEPTATANLPILSAPESTEVAGSPVRPGTLPPTSPAASAGGPTAQATEPRDAKLSPGSPAASTAPPAATASSDPLTVAASRGPPIATAPPAGAASASVESSDDLPAAAELTPSSPSSGGRRAALPWRPLAGGALALVAIITWVWAASREPASTEPTSATGSPTSASPGPLSAALSPTSTHPAPTSVGSAATSAAESPTSMGPAALSAPTRPTSMLAASPSTIAAPASTAGPARSPAPASALARPPAPASAAPPRRPATEPSRPTPPAPGSAVAVVAPAPVATEAAAPATEAAAPATEAPPPAVAAPGAASEPPPAAPLARGPRARAASAGGAVRSLEGGAVDGWQPVGARGLFLHVPGRGGPTVRVRLFAHDGRFLANLNSEPASLRVLVDGRAMGGTPVASLPLGTGHRELRFEGPDGSETRLSLDLEP